MNDLVPNMEPNEHDRQKAPGFGPCDPAFIRPFPEHLKNLVKMDRYTAIDEKLKSIVTDSPTTPPWHDAWQHSTRGRKGFPWRPDQEAGPEERLSVFQMIRDSGMLPTEAGFYLVADQLRFLTELRIGEIFDEIDRRIDALYAEHGFQDWREQSRRDYGDFLQFEERCPLDWDRLYFETLRKHGEDEIARLYRTRREDFEQRMRAGRDYFLPPPPETAGADEGEEEIGDDADQPAAPAWADDLHDELVESGCFTVVKGGEVTLRMSFAQHEDHADIAFSLSPARLVGGPRDGEVVFRTFVLDIGRLWGLFEDVSDIRWDSFGYHPTSFVTQVLIEGTYQGHPLILRVLGMPDECYEPDPTLDS